jgi:hypothetical protein
MRRALTLLAGVACAAAVAVVWRELPAARRYLNMTRM